MRTLRKTSIESFIRTLDSTLLTRYAFETSFNNESGEIVRIVLREDPAMFFVITQDDKGTDFTTSECPGVTFTEAERYKLNNIYDGERRIREWVNRIIEERIVHGRGNADFFDKLRQNLDAAADDLPEPEKPYDEEAATEWQTRFDSLIEQLEELREKSEIQQRDLNELKGALNELMQQVHSLPKRTFFRAAGHKILNVLERLSVSAAGRLLSQTAVKLLLGNGDFELPDPHELPESDPPHLA